MSVVVLLRQAYNKPFDSPAVLVVGHQTSGKSALIEALMGFQFNEVGGGTKTRRPISLQMQYNPNCTVPKCFLTTDGDGERTKSLSESQVGVCAISGSSQWWYRNILDWRTPDWKQLRPSTPEPFRSGWSNAIVTI